MYGRISQEAEHLLHNIGVLAWPHLAAGGLQQATASSNRGGTPFLPRKSIFMCLY